MEDEKTNLDIKFQLKTPSRIVDTMTLIWRNSNCSIKIVHQSGPHTRPKLDMSAFVSAEDFFEKTYFKK